MKILAVFLLSLIVTVPSYAKEETSVAPTQVIVREITKDTRVLPDCNDPKLIKKMREFISDYFEKTNDHSTQMRRRGYFLKNKIAEFQQENLVNYRSEKQRPISDMIITLKMNEGMLDENMRLCKNTSRYPHADELYMLYHAVDDGIKVYIINLEINQIEMEQMPSFVYE